MARFRWRWLPRREGSSVVVAEGDAGDGAPPIDGHGWQEAGQFGFHADRWTPDAWGRIFRLVPEMFEKPITREDIAAAVRAARGARGDREAASRSARVDSADLVAVYLFGSRARGTARADSDVDLGLLYSVAPAPTLLAQPFLLEAQLAEQLGRRVQCVVMNTAPVDLVHRILKDGVLLFDASPSQRIRFEIGARNRYFDLKPMLDRYRRARRIA